MTGHEWLVANLEGVVLWYMAHGIFATDVISFWIWLMGITPQEGTASEITARAVVWHGGSGPISSLWHWLISIGR